MQPLQICGVAGQWASCCLLLLKIIQRLDSIGSYVREQIDAKKHQYYFSYLAAEGKACGRMRPPQYPVPLHGLIDLCVLLNI